MDIKLDGGHRLITIVRLTSEIIRWVIIIIIIITIIWCEAWLYRYYFSRHLHWYLVGQNIFFVYVLQNLKNEKKKLLSACLLFSESLVSVVTIFISNISFLGFDKMWGKMKSMDSMLVQIVGVVMATRHFTQVYMCSIIIAGF